MVVLPTAVRGYHSQLSCWQWQRHCGSDSNIFYKEENVIAMTMRQKIHHQIMTILTNLGDWFIRKRRWGLTRLWRSLAMLGDGDGSLANFGDSSFFFPDLVFGWRYSLLCLNRLRLEFLGNLDCWLFLRCGKQQKLAPGIFNWFLEPSTYGHIRGMRNCE